LMSLARRLYLLRWWRSLLFAARCPLHADCFLPICVRSRQICRRFTGSFLKDNPEGQRPAQSCCPAFARTRQLGNSGAGFLGLGRSAGASQAASWRTVPKDSVLHKVAAPLAQGRASWAADLDLPAFAVSAERDASGDKQALDSGAASCTTPPERGGYEQQKPRFMSPDTLG
jgi:hypothetical protein